ncbi:MAG: phosphoribosyltransferase family protein [Aquincola sp.]|nr:phosphoribosyltransferase family protein [Aquincola sp.]
MDYAFPWSRLVVALKFHAAIDLADAMAGLLARAAREAPSPRADLVLPVPLSRERLAERGMNQAWELARRTARLLGVPATAHGLSRPLDTPRLADLPRESRTASIRGAFALAPGASAGIRGRSVALVDDVMTTGATAAEATRTLLAAGASSVQVWVFARTPAPGDA